MIRKCYLAAILMLSACASGPVGNAHVPEPKHAVELQRYLGKWYEIARYENRFERNCEGVTAEYSLRDDGLIGIRNTCHKNTIDGQKDVSEGKARVVENSQNAKLEVSFFGPFFMGDYWVLNHAEDYSWSIVGEPSGRYLWLLSRAPILSAEQKNDLFGKMKALGYDLSLLRETRQKN